MTDPVKQTQTELNLATYEEVMKGCFGAAKRIAEKESLNDDTQKEVALAIFERFYNDQLELTKQKQLTGVVAGMVQQALDMRRM